MSPTSYQAAPPRALILRDSLLFCNLTSSGACLAPKNSGTVTLELLMCSVKTWAQMFRLVVDGEQLFRNPKSKG
jgi:hypothetical protein